MTVFAVSLFLSFVAAIFSLCVLPLFLLQFLIFQSLWLNFHAPRQSLLKNIFSCKTLRYIPEIFQRIFHEEQLYYIDKETLISTSNTWLAASQSKLTHLRIGTKICRRNRTNDANSVTANKALANLIDGFKFNKRFAPGVYLGLARIEQVDETKIRRSRIIFIAMKWNIKPGKYAVVMRWLNPTWRLDNRLCAIADPIMKKSDMEFLAQEVARMHKRTYASPHSKGLPESIVKKLRFNMRFFKQTLEKLSQDGIDVRAYQQIGSLLECAVSYLQPGFQQRYNQGHIKRCHGDLKLTNLWVKPASGKHHQQLLALDCIDFNPDFCHIDTLSDVAMLIMDLQMHLKQDDKSLVEVFISAYLSEMVEDRKKVMPLLKYYIMEKAMVCANVSILLDNAPEHGKKYLAQIQLHAQELQKLLPSPNELVVNAQEATDTTGLAAIS